MSELLINIIQSPHHLFIYLTYTSTNTHLTIPSLNAGLLPRLQPTASYLPPPATIFIKLSQTPSPRQAPPPINIVYSD